MLKILVFVFFGLASAIVAFGECAGEAVPAPVADVKAPPVPAVAPEFLRVPAGTHAPAAAPAADEAPKFCHWNAPARSAEPGASKKPN